ncbi:hypothetical protein BN1723_000215, partial [Verticillium longisporum]
MIRAHNEVMQVIGVAEPDNVPTEADLESVRRHVDYEETMGHRLLRIGRTLEVGGVWGVNGLRARILLYKRYADISFFDLFRYERSQCSMSNLFLAGLPTFLAGHALKLGSHQWAPSAATGADWGKKARRRQREVLKMMMDAEEERLAQEQEDEEDKDIEEFLIKE